jgi:uncharacterized protein YyaL (SSP411 family)
MHSYTNRLINETSPYLLQHSHNPVDWYPWSNEAFEKALKEDKPILVSIGYAACHWCHVMERESFENPETAALMNEHFVNIKVDREERPDVDHIYMDAVQAMTGGGGWPLNVFLTPERKPFYGGTYYPPQRAFNRASWTEVLQAIQQAYKDQKTEIEGQANNLTEHLKTMNVFGSATNVFTYDAALITKAFENLMKTADKKSGGFGNAPKFPQTFAITFLLRYAFLNDNEEALQQAILSLDKMIQGGIYDQLGGGFARYSTDAQWLVPHFEKMLYDNALMVSTLSETFQLTQNGTYKQAISETLDFIEREMMHEQGGFFSALDADSEGEEGKFYVWDYEEVEKVLGNDADLFRQYFNVSKIGNWEGKNILHIQVPLKDFALQHNIHPENLWSFINNSKKALLNERNKRVRPSLDDKVILSWNALMNTAFSKAYAATGEEHYKEIAVKNMNFLLQAFATENEGFHHTWKNGQARHHGFLDDYSLLISALIHLSKITADVQWLQKASSITEYVIENFGDEYSPLFFYTHQLQTDVLLRKKEVYDSALPSGNSMMALNLYQLSIIFDRKDWHKKAEEMTASFADLAVKYPASFGLWLSVLYEITSGSNEIAIIGQSFYQDMKNVLQLYLPHSIIMGSSEEKKEFPLLKFRGVGNGVLFYLCKNYTCQRPVGTIDEFKKLLTSNIFNKNIQ